MTARRIQRYTLAIAAARNATEFAAVIEQTITAHGPEPAARLLGANWTRGAGRKVNRNLIARMLTRGAVPWDWQAQDRAQARIGYLLMEPAERLALRMLAQIAGPLTLHRCCGVRDERTGWFQSPAGARAAWEAFNAPRIPWPRHKAPRFMETATAKANAVLALKTVGDHVEIVLVPDDDRRMPVEQEAIR